MTLSFRERRICVICEDRTSKSPWIICKQCGEFIVNNWTNEAYRV